MLHTVIFYIFCLTKTYCLNYLNQGSHWQQLLLCACPLSTRLLRSPHSLTVILSIFCLTKTFYSKLIALGLPLATTAALCLSFEHKVVKESSLTLEKCRERSSSRGSACCTLSLQTAIVKKILPRFVSQNFFFSKTLASGLPLATTAALCLPFEHKVVVES
jgi:hypothetical protein